MNDQVAHPSGWLGSWSVVTMERSARDVLDMCTWDQYNAIIATFINNKRNIEWIFYFIIIFNTGSIQ